MRCKAHGGAVYYHKYMGAVSLNGRVSKRYFLCDVYVATSLVIQAASRRCEKNRNFSVRFRAVLSKTNMRMKREKNTTFKTQPKAVKDSLL